jgi:glycerate 2-kinase
MNPPTDLIRRTRDDAVAIFEKGLEAVAPDVAVRRFCQRRGNALKIGEQSFQLDKYDRIFVVGAGKATAPMASTLEELLGDDLSAGVITVKYGHTAKLSKIQTVEAGHPVPDRNGELGSEKILSIATSAGEKDLLFCLISGGGSALLPKAAPGVSLADKQETTRILLACGATIHEINMLRKHLSIIKGGQLAVTAAPATVVSLILSDVVGDNLDAIASGPTVPDNSTFADCMKIVNKYAIADQLPEPVLNHLKKGLSGQVPETPKADDPVFENTSNIVIGSNIEALLAAEKEAAGRGYTTQVLSSMIEGETCEVARLHSAIAREILRTGHPVKPPACILSGGETTVTLKGDGLGGRNQEFALCAAADIAGTRPVVLLSGGTDGNDGPTDAAGAIVDNTTIERAATAKLNIAGYLSNNDSYHFFKALGDLLITGPTNTNVMDLRILLIPE